MTSPKTCTIRAILGIVSLILAAAVVLVVHYVKAYDRGFHAMLERKAAMAAEGRPYCVVVPRGVDSVELVDGFTGISFLDLLWPVLFHPRHIRLRDDYYGREIHFGIVVEGKGYHWSFWNQAFVRNQTSTCFYRSSLEHLPCRCLGSGFQKEGANMIPETSDEIGPGPPIRFDPSTLREPPDSAPHGPVVDSLSLGIWTEEHTYEINRPVNVWLLLTNHGQTPYDVGIHSHDLLIIEMPDCSVRKHPMGPPIDGFAGAGFKGGISEMLHRVVRMPGVYRLRWEVGKLRSNVVDITVVNHKAE
jgi:hypothetical protein